MGSKRDLNENPAHPIAARARAAHERAGSPPLNALEDAHGLGRGVLHRLLRGATADPREDTIERAARALGVSPRWLRHGEADPESMPPPPVSDRYPSRAQLVALARARGVSDALLQALALDPYSATSDPGIAYWTERLGALADADRALGDALGQRATARVDRVR